MLPSSYSSSSFLCRTCPYHDDQTLDLYCQQCTIPVCVKCGGISHKDHPVHQVSQQVIQGSGLEQFNGPWDIKISPEGKMYIADRNNSRIVVFHADLALSLILLMGRCQVTEMSLVQKAYPLIYNR